MFSRLVVVLAAVSSFAACKSKVPERAAVAPCAEDADCGFYCESKGDCCHNPYCEVPGLTSQGRAIDAYNRDHCTRDDYGKCPQIGSRMDPGYVAVARCRAGSCVAERITRDASAPSSTTPAAAVDVSGYDRSCKTKSECAIVKSAPCDKCGCPNTPIAARDMPRFTAAASAITCDAVKDTRVCGECRGSVPDCQGGQCVAAPEK